MASKRTTHVLIPYTTEVACGQHGFTANTGYRDTVTCKRCKKTEWYKTLPALPRKFRK